MGEGFGIPVIEAQACGTPVIVSDFSAQSELVGGGWRVEGQPYWNEAMGAFLFMPYIGGIVARLEEAYASRGDAQIRQQAIDKAAEYDSALVFDRYWRPVLAEMEARLTVRPNRAQRRAKKARGKAA
jgi:glycosyltransferase involved in cell wall biosynthesis